MEELIEKDGRIVPHSFRTYKDSQKQNKEK